MHDASAHPVSEHDGSLSSMMIAVFAAMLLALLLGWFGRSRAAVACAVAAMLLAVGLFLYEIYSPEYGFRMPWIRTDLGRPAPAGTPISVPLVRPLAA